MKKFLIAVNLVSLAHTQNKSTERGLGYGHHTPEDREVTSMGISWWYNWCEAPDQGIKRVNKDLGVEVIPMTWGNS